MGFLLMILALDDLIKLEFYKLNTFYVETLKAKIFLKYRKNNIK